MPERDSGARQTSSEAREEFSWRIEELWDLFTSWHQGQPEATFDEMEAEPGKQRLTILGNFLELSLRQGDEGEPWAGSGREDSAILLCVPYLRDRNFSSGPSPMPEKDSRTGTLVEIAARLGSTQPSFAIAAETFSELARVGISTMTVWRHHRQVTSNSRQK